MILIISSITLYLRLKEQARKPRDQEWHPVELDRSNGSLFATFRNYGNIPARNVIVKVREIEDNSVTTGVMPDENFLEKDIVEVGEKIEIIYRLDNQDSDEVRIRIFTDRRGVDFNVRFGKDRQPSLPSWQKKSLPLYPRLKNKKNSLIRDIKWKLSDDKVW